MAEWSKVWVAGVMLYIRKGLSIMYNKDLRESWETIRGYVKTVSDRIKIATGVLATLEIRSDRMRAVLDPFILATDIADYLMRKGVPLRKTHHISGREQTSTPMIKLM
ncbi:hypothetical protein GGR51DRAFT_556736 [Nemania sp. FL0031]|nr:hypothetical protein GGR51DRAFT_556736 [Nemania sp. FL0031]